MNPTQKAFNHVVAFEVSKHELVVHELPSDTQCRIANEPKAVRRLLRAKERTTADALGIRRFRIRCVAGARRPVCQRPTTV